MDPLDVARRFFDAIERGDLEAVAAIYAPDAVIWHNDDQTETSPAENLKVLKSLVKHSQARAYGQRRTLATAEGFVQQHVLELTALDGRVLTLPACLVCRVEAGRIVRLDEYLDGAPVRAFFAAAPPA